MSEQHTIVIQRPEGPVTLTFGEVTVEQRPQYHKLCAQAFGWPLSEEDYAEREEFLDPLPLTRDGRWRFWCVARADDPSQVVAACKTIHRDLLIRDARGVRLAKGYGIASVVTHPDYRRCGLAAFLMKEVAEWLDGPGNAAASILYSNVGDFYVDKGWKMLSIFQSKLSAASASTEWDRSALPEARILTKEDIGKLCPADIEYLKEEFATYEPATAHDIRVAVLPTADIVSWLHARSEFTARKLKGKTPEVKGAACDELGVWMYWYHDLRKQALLVQRIHTGVNESEAVIRALARLLTDALLEAKAWDMATVVIWDPCPKTQRAIKFLTEELGVSAVNEERKDAELPSIRWRSAEDRNTIMSPNEFYAWH
ncbi:hypothetical protein F4809DRAFT_637404 [Biscogniauxia mediterranea]|nr:hypothetical protein F4809DRAFT_637404 [Biscogniauxia mediterranea]